MDNCDFCCIISADISVTVDAFEKVGSIMVVMPGSALSSSFFNCSTDWISVVIGQSEVLWGLSSK